MEETEAKDTEAKDAEAKGAGAKGGEARGPEAARGGDAAVAGGGLFQFTAEDQDCMKGGAE